MKHVFFSVMMTVMVVSMSGRAYSQGILEKDSAIVVQKTNTASLNRDYEIMSQEEDIAGDLVAGTEKAFKAWKDACAEWKKEVRENNKGNQIIQLNCGKPVMDRGMSSTGQYRYESKAVSKVRVKIRDK